MYKQNAKEEAVEFETLLFSQVIEKDLPKLIEDMEKKYVNNINK